jgi:ribosome biogenesis SPOUT family RNA methylase Rps3
LSGRTKLVIENREPTISDWLLAEYGHSASIWPDTIFTNVTDGNMKAALQKMARPVAADVL